MAGQYSESVMEAVRTAFERSELSYEQLGARMGYTTDTARKSAWQFVNRTNDPRWSMLHRFAEALDIPLTELLEQSAPTK